MVRNTHVIIARVLYTPVYNVRNILYEEEISGIKFMFV